MRDPNWQRNFQERMQKQAEWMERNNQRIETAWDRLFFMTYGYDRARDNGEEQRVIHIPPAEVHRDIPIPMGMDPQS